MTNETTPPSFRDRLYTIDESGKRLWVFAKKPKGPLTTWRNIVGLLLVAFLFAAPFLRVNGQHFLLLDFFHRKFVFFGVQFWPQDFNLFFVAMISLIVFIFLFTVTFGRLWCGWACPQTVFMEVIFRRLEYWIEGDHNEQKKLDALPWNWEKIRRRGLKHLVFYIVSFAIGNVFLMYLIGSDAWISLVTDHPANHWAGLAGMFVFSFVFYFIFSWFREQVCTIVCPYGRLQGVLLDPNSVVISYDYVRGEERAPFRKSEDRKESGKGDCIDCKQCVQVCPTGIDIRNGTQLECINCACCIDACNEVMDRVGYRRGLIRYASEVMIAGGIRWKPTWKTMAYSLVFAALFGVFAFLLSTRTPVEVTLLRAPGMLFQDGGDDKISNLYNVRVVNMTQSVYPLEFRLLSHSGKINLIGKPVKVGPQEISESVFFIFLDKKDIQSERTEIRIGVYSDGQLLDDAASTFFGPKP